MSDGHTLEQITPILDFPRAVEGMFDLTGKTAFVPGGYGGLGEAIAWGMAVNGAEVMIAGRSLAKSEALARKMNDAGFKAHGVALDVTSVKKIHNVVDRAVATMGRLDILVNCVGTQIEQPILDVTEEAYDLVYQTNLKAAMFLGQAAAKHQVAEGKGGKQVHLLSVRSQLGIQNRGYSSYCSTKGGMAMLVKQHAMELAPHAITVNGVAPTFVYTEMIRHVMENAEFKEYLLDRIPLGRIADPHDVVGPVLFFVAPGSNFVTGQNLYVDGGITACQ